MAEIRDKQWWINYISPILTDSLFEVKLNPCENENCVIVVLKEEYKEYNKKKDHYFAVKPYKNGGFSMWMKMDVYQNFLRSCKLPNPTRIHGNMPHFTKMDDEALVLDIIASLVKTFVAKEPIRTYICD
jgi:hypothetical protein